MSLDLQTRPTRSTTTPTHTPAETGGLLLAVVSAATFATSGPLAKSLLDAGWSTGSTSLLRIGGGALVLLPFTVFAVLRRRPAVRDVRLAAVYGVVAVAGAQFSFFNAVQYLSVGVALLLEFLAPVLIVLLTWARTGQVPGRFTLAGTAMSLLGLLLVLDLTGTTSVNVVGVAWGLLAAVCLSAHFLLSARDLPTMSSLTLAGFGMAAGGLAIALLGVLGVLPMVATTAPVTLLGSPTSWIVPVGVMILVSTVAAYIMGIVAVKRLGSRLASFVGLTEVLFAVFFAWLLVGQLPGLAQVLGGLCILAGVVLVKVDRSAMRPGVLAPAAG